MAIELEKTEQVRPEGLYQQQGMLSTITSDSVYDSADDYSWATAGEFKEYKDPDFLPPSPACLASGAELCGILLPFNTAASPAWLRST